MSDFRGDDTPDRMLAIDVAQARWGWNLHGMPTKSPWDLEGGPGQESLCVEVAPARSIPGPGRIDPKKCSGLKMLSKRGKDVWVVFVGRNGEVQRVRIDAFASDGMCKIPEEEQEEYLDLSFDILTESAVEHFMDRYFECPQCKSEVLDERAPIQCDVCSYQTNLPFNALAREAFKCPKCRHEAPLDTAKINEWKAEDLVCQRHGHKIKGKTRGDYVGSLSLKKRIATFRVNKWIGPLIGIGWLVGESHLIVAPNQEEAARNLIRTKKEEYRSIVEGRKETGRWGSDFEGEWNANVTLHKASTKDVEVVKNQVRRRARNEIENVYRNFTDERKRGQALSMLKEKDLWRVVDELLQGRNTDRDSQGLLL